MRTLQGRALAAGTATRTAVGVFAFALILGIAGCGRRGPPLAPLQVDPETPRVLPLQQESGQVVVRWYAPRLDSGGDVADLRLRRAIVSYRVLDIYALAAEERAAQRRPPEEVDEQASEEPPSGDEEATGTPEPESPGAGTAEETASNTVEAPAEGEAPPESPEPPETAEPETEEPLPEPAQSGEARVPEQPPAAPPEEQATAGEASPEESETELTEETETEPDTTEQEPGAGEPAGEEAGSEATEQTAEPEAEPEPTGVLLDYEDLEFEVLSEVESEVLGEERVLELPVEPDWIGRRLEIRVRYEARGGASEESEPQSLDISGPLPAVEGVLVDVGPRELTVRWEDPREALDPVTPLADPVFEVFRRRGAESESVGRSLGLSHADPDVVWGEEVCYRARLVMAGTDDERVLPDPGIEAPEPSAADRGGEPESTPGEAGEAGAPGTAGEALGNPEGDAALAPEETETEAEPWTPIPIRVPGTGTGALSVGPMSAESCVVPMDVFPPLPPSDLRLFWQAQQTDLSWEESASTDVAGYHVYRSGPDGAGFERLTESLVEQTSFTDADRDPRGGYRYAITAVDGADPPNESLPSDPRTVNPR